MKNFEEKKDFENLKTEGFSVLMLWAEGCHVCKEAKPKFSALAKQFDSFNFFKATLNDNTYGFYTKYEEPKMIDTPSIDEDGDPILDASGDQITFKKEGYNVSVPMFYVLNQEEATEEDSYGLLGKVEGHNIEMLTTILSQIKDMDEAGNE